MLLVSVGDIPGFVFVLFFVWGKKLFLIFKWSLVVQIGFSRGTESIVYVYIYIYIFIHKSYLYKNKSCLYTYTCGCFCVGICLYAMAFASLEFIKCSICRVRRFWCDNVAFGIKRLSTVEPKELMLLMKSEGSRVKSFFSS